MCREMKFGPLTGTSPHERVYPISKKFTEERELTIMLMIDISGSGDFGSAASSKREIMAELGSVLAFSAVRNNDKVWPGPFF